MKSKTLIIGLAMLALINFSNAWGASANMTTTVERVLTSAGTLYGGCMALLEGEPSSTGLVCTGRWVTFSCSGDFASRQDALRNFEMAQLAYALEKRVRVTLQDNFTHNGYCFARRIEMMN